jgi:hypothetical protein
LRVPRASKGGEAGGGLFADFDVILGAAQLVALHELYLSSIALHPERLCPYYLPLFHIYHLLLLFAAISKDDKHPDNLLSIRR